MSLNSNIMENSISNEKIDVNDQPPSKNRIVIDENQKNSDCNFKMSKSTINVDNETNMTNNTFLNNSSKVDINVDSNENNSKSKENMDQLSKRNKRQTPASSLKKGTKVSFLSYNQEIENSEILLNYAFDSPRTFKSIKGRKQTPMSKHLIDDLDKEVAETNESFENSDCKDNNITTSKKINFNIINNNANENNTNIVDSENNNDLSLSNEVSRQINIINRNDEINEVNEKNDEPVIDFRSLGRHSKKSHLSNRPILINELDERINTVLSLKSQTLDRKSIAKSKKSDISSSEIISSFDGSFKNNDENESKDNPIFINNKNKKKLKSILKKRISLPEQIEEIIVRASQQLHNTNTNTNSFDLNSQNNINESNSHPIYIISENSINKDILEIDSINDHENVSQLTANKIIKNLKKKKKSESNSKSKSKSKYKS